MRNGASTLIKKAMTGLGVSLIESAIEIEGAKGCSPILCQNPVELEPPYRAFDSQVILAKPRREDETEETELRDVLLTCGPVETLSVYAAPEDLLTAPWMETCMRACSVLRGRFAFELFGSHGRVSVRFVIPADEVPAFHHAIGGLFPAVRLVPDPSPFPTYSDESGAALGQPLVVEELVPVGPYYRSLSLLGKDGPTSLGVVASSIAGIGEDDRAFYQVLLKAADPTHDWHYNVANLAEAEARARDLSVMGGLSSRFAFDEVLPPLQEPSVQEKVRIDVAFFAAVPRYGIWSGDERVVDTYLQGCRAASAMVRFGNRQFRTLDNETLVANLGQAGVRRMVVERLTHRPGIMLTSQEVVTLAHIPNARTLEMFGCIEQRKGLEWTGPQSNGAEQDGAATLGTNEFAGESRLVDIPLSDRLRHMVLSGVTGTGKSTEQETLILSDAEAGLGVCLIDPHGDLAVEILSRLPESRMQDLEVVTFTEAGLAPRWNPVGSAGPSGKIADDVVRAFAATTPNFGPRMEHVIRSLVYTVHRLGGTLVSPAG